MRLIRKTQNKPQRMRPKLDDIVSPSGRATWKKSRNDRKLHTRTTQQLQLQIPQLAQMFILNYHLFSLSLNKSKVVCGILLRSWEKAFA